jgi:hypothetical protein
LLNVLAQKCFRVISKRIEPVEKLGADFICGD